MIQTATLSPMLPAQARSTTAPNGPTLGDFAVSFAQANDDAASFAADGAPNTPMPTIAIPALSPGTIARQDAAVTGNALPIPAIIEPAKAIVPEIAVLLAVPLATGQPPISQVPIALAPSAIPAKTDPAPADLAAKRGSATRPTATARAAAFAASSRSGKAKADAPTTASDDTADASRADQPALPGQTAIDPPIVAASPDALLAAPFVPAPPADGTQLIVAGDAVAPDAPAIGGAAPIGTSAAGAKPGALAVPDRITPMSTPTAVPRQSRTAARVAQAQLAVPSATPVPAGPVPAGSAASSPVALRAATRLIALPVATSAAGPAVEMVDHSPITPPSVALTPAIPITTTPVATPPLQIAALTATLPVTPSPASGIPALGLASEPGSAARPLEPAPLAFAPDANPSPIATPRWVATGATTPVALALALPVAVQPQAGTVASASQVFGAAIQAATKARDERDATDPTAPSLAAGAPVSPMIKIAEANQAPLDMRQERWPHTMIERIEILRDAADVTDTRIRLIPDALGAIDVSLKKDGDTVRVHFHAEQGATRAMLQDAQPRLVELAEARGLKLGQGTPGQTAFGDGTAGNGQPRAPATPQTPTRNPNRTATLALVDAPEDIRIA